MKNNTIAILGAGRFGTALRTVLNKGGLHTCAWDIRDGPDVERNLHKALSFSPHVIIAIATQHVRDVCQKIQDSGLSLSHCWIGSKGIEKITGWFLSDVVEHFFPTCTTGVLAGPNIAKEMQEGWPCGLTLASQCPDALARARSWFSKTSLIIRETSDILGVQALGAMKNIISIGYGLLEQNCPSSNMHATYLTLAMQEISGIIKDLGGKAETILGFAGWGDVIVSCAKGRNRQFGLNFPSPSQELAEGVDTLHALFQKMGPSLKAYPIVQGIYDIISGHRPVQDMLQIVR